MTRTLVGRLGVLVLSTTACAGAEPPELDRCETVDGFVSCLPDWNAFADNGPSTPPQPMGEPTSSEVQDTLNNLEGDDEPAVVSQNDVTFACTSQTYSMQTNPEKLVMFRPDPAVMWPGGLVQGASYANGEAFKELPIAERSPVELSIPTLLDGNGTRVVEDPTSARVANAIGEMVGSAEAAGLSTASNIDFTREEYHGESQFGLSANVSGRYLGFEASASGSLSTNVSESTVTANLTQTLFEVSVPTPPQPRDFFSADFTTDRLREQEELGRIGPANPPLFVSNVVYGRMMMFSVKAAASSSEIEAALDASYRSVGASASGSLTTRQQELLSSATIRFTQIGGDQDAALRAIQSGNLAEFFSDRVPLTAAAPLQFTLKTLTGEVAKVTEPGEYTVTTCEPRLPGSIDFEGRQTIETEFTSGTTRNTVVGDFDGDGIDDIAWNERESGAGAFNRVVVGFANEDGQLSADVDDVSSQAVPPEGWRAYALHVADTNGDGLDDLLWNARGEMNAWHVALSLGDGTFEWRPRQALEETGNWGAYPEPHIMDVNADGRDDLVWNLLGGTNAVAVSVADENGDLSTGRRVQTFGFGWEDYEAKVGDVNNDGCPDLMWNATTQTRNDTWIGQLDCGTSTFEQVRLRSYGEPGWGSYLWFVGDFDDEHGIDLGWVNPTVSSVPIHRSYTTATGWDPRPFQDMTAEVPGDWHDSDALHLARGQDVNNDGKDDLLFTQRTDNKNTLVVGLGTGELAFAFPAGPLDHPSTPADGWLTFDQLEGDFNGDGRKDVAWSKSGSATEVYIGLAR